MEPRKEVDLIAWLRKYRPDFVGEFEAAGLVVTVAERSQLENWRPALLEGYGINPRSLAALQMAQHQPMLQSQVAYTQYQQGLWGQAQGRGGLGLGGLFSPLI